MRFDLFLSICQTEVDGYTPSERQMFLNFFDQVKLADELGFGTAWVAETHLSCQVQKQNPGAVIPEFNGEIGLNTDILQLGHKVFAQTKQIHIGSAIRNIICNGGPIAHAEAVRTFLTLHGLTDGERRKLHLGFAAGRFPFSNTPYGFYPKTDFEKVSWDVIKNKYFQEATEIFLRILMGEQISSKEISTRYLEESNFRDPKQWQKAWEMGQKEHRIDKDRIRLDHHWTFEKVGVLPFEAPLELLDLTIGSHDPETQFLANQICPVGVFNLSITPTNVIEETHQRMAKSYHPKGGPWKRSLMPRTLLLFIDDSPGSSDQTKSQNARLAAQKAWENYWRAMEGTLDPQKIAAAVENTISGHPQEVLEKIQKKYDKEDRLMLWFDFNNHDSESVKRSMTAFMTKVAPALQ
jgi:alkanesulfonate monooxygenase SsuD/methylene tetrahydromethanopterin reductase-like flavin-dependent oxidoreductase (luciferase family)